MAKTKNTVPRKPAPPPPPDDRASSVEVGEITLRSLHAHAGAHDTALRAVLLANVSDEDLVAEGTELSSEAIVDSVPGFVAGVKSSYAALDATRRALLVGYAPALDALIVHEATALDALSRGRDGAKGESAVAGAASRAVLRAAISHGVMVRDQAARALGEELGSDVRAQAKLAEAKGTAESAAALERGLRAVATRVREHYAAASPGTKRVLDALGLGEGRAAELEREAAEVRAAGEASVPGEDARVAQRKLDRQDGVVLALVGRVWRAFRDAHARDGSIVVPPLGRMAHHFHHRSGKRAGASGSSGSGSSESGSSGSSGSGGGGAAG